MQAKPDGDLWVVSFKVKGQDRSIMVFHLTQEQFDTLDFKEHKQEYEMEIKNNAK